MPVPLINKKQYEKDRLDRAIDEFAALKKATIGDLNCVVVAAQLQEGINKYRADAKGMTMDQLKREAHDSAVLGEHMAALGDPRPHSECDAHAIISGAHDKAGPQRAVLARFMRRIDDPINGCWLAS